MVAGAAVVVVVGFAVVVVVAGLAVVVVEAGFAVVVVVARAVVVAVAALTVDVVAGGAVVLVVDIDDDVVGPVLVDVGAVEAVLVVVTTCPLDRAGVGRSFCPEPMAVRPVSATRIQTAACATFGQERNVRQDCWSQPGGGVEPGGVVELGGTGGGRLTTAVPYSAVSFGPSAAQRAARSSKLTNSGMEGPVPSRLAGGLQRESCGSGWHIANQTRRQRRRHPLGGSGRFERLRGQAGDDRGESSHGRDGRGDPGAVTRGASPVRVDG